MNVLKRRNLLLVLAALLAAVLAVTITVRYRSVKNVVDVVQSLPAGVELALQDIDYTHSDAGVVRWHFKAERAERSVSEGRLAVKNLLLTFYDESGARQMVLRADEGDADKDFNELSASGNVFVESERGYRLTSDRLVYKQQEQKIYSDAHVVIESDDLTVAGNGLVLDVKGRTMFIYDGVEAVLSGTAASGARQ